MDFDKEIATVHNQNETEKSSDRNKTMIELNHQELDINKDEINVTKYQNDNVLKDTIFESIDDLLSSEKWYGKYQLLIQAAFVYLAIVICWNFVLSIFTGTQSSWKCVQRNSSTFCKVYYNETFDTKHALFKERCKLNRSEWTFTKPKDNSFVTEFDLVCEKSALVALVDSSYYIGGFIGALLGGNMSDNLGRKSTLLIGVFVAFCFSFGGRFVSNVWQLFILNIIVGGSSVTVYCGELVYLEEFVPPFLRPFAGMLLQVSMTLSYLLIDWVASFGFSWRQLKLYSALPSVFALLIFFFLIPKSPRWLVSKGKHSEANSVLKRLFKKSIKEESTSQKKAKEKSVFNYTHFFCSVKVFLTLVRTTMVWFTLGITGYTMIFSSPDLGGSIYFAFALTNLPTILSCVVSSYLANRIGRKKTVLGFLSVTAMILGCKGIVTSLNQSTFEINITFVMTAQFFSVISFCTCYTWTFEIYPTCIRSQGVALCILAERIGICVAPFMTKLLIGVSNSSPFYIVCGLGLISVLIGYQLPETKDLSTRETFDALYDEKGGTSLDTCTDNGLDNKFANFESWTMTRQDVSKTISLRDY